MLTKWRHARTSFEHTTGTDGATNKGTHDLTNPSSGEIAISFVKPLAGSDPFYNERVNSSKNSGKRRRKSNKDIVDGSSSVDDLTPVLCLTSSHRVAILGYPSSNSGVNLTESKSRNYVSPPGKFTSFHLKNNTDSVEGVLSGGAQYDPTSNLIYAIRNGGSELAIWTAASSSTIQGPDQGHDANIDVGVSDTVHHITKKRKERDISPSFDRVISQRLSFPKGKIAVTLTPFYVPLSLPEEKNRLLAIGASGCCEDGSVWIAICRNTNEDSPFKLIVVDGSSMAETGLNGATTTTKSNKRKSTGGKAKKKREDVATNVILLDSRAVGVLESENDKHTGSFNVNVQSVVLSRDDGSVVLRHHQVRVDAKGGEEQYHINQSKKQTILKVPSKDFIIASLDKYGNSLCIVHKNDEGSWTTSTVEVSLTDGTIVNSLSSLPLSRGPEGKGTLFSFGSLGQNMYAILLKEESKTPDRVLKFTLRVVDVRRKIELFAQSWFESDSQHDATNASDTVMAKMMRGKHCRAMITNELDASLAFVTSSPDSSGSFGIMFSTISATEFSSASIRENKLVSKASSLASALRAAASSEPSLTNDSSTACLSSCHLSDMTLNSSDHLRNHKSLDAAVDIACKNLNEAAKSLLDFTSGFAAVDKKLVSNGKSRKDAGHNTSELPNWKYAFLDGMAIIQESSGSKSITTKVLTNGLKNGVTGESKRHKNRNVKELPKRYIDVAFRRTVSILLSIHKSAKYSTDDVKMKLETIHQEALFVLLKTLQAECLSSRDDFDFDLPNGENVLLQVLRVSSSVLGCNNGLVFTPSKASVEKHRMFGALDIVDAMLRHVRDLPECVLVCMIKCLMRNVAVDDVVYYYSKNVEASQCSRSSEESKLAQKFYGLIVDSKMDVTDDLRSQMTTKLLANAVLNFTLKIVMYSKCNHSLLSRSLRDAISAPEVETFLVTLSKLLKYGDCSAYSSRNERSCVPLHTRVIDWMSALTDAHLHSILKISNQGGLVIDRIQADVRSALIQAETANKLKDIADSAVACLSERSKQSNTLAKKCKSRESTVAAYSIERLTF
ncbi:hypothetical protein HJC23_000395 [Cyclotella cryptica]|uniref:Uncharacterized protein n=1 Tax=Cyclotella cryptica TaxID=29204 RepID=A0ABD3PIA7_9STRA|eukprot:CCRYP_014143-RA/>CCRYP_014143-RA protein AED:0.03 eAED:0.03 QI:552/1/1/1/0/0/3/58/1065